MIVPPPLVLLRSTCPEWFKISAANADSIEGVAQILPPGAARGLTVELNIGGFADCAAVREGTSGTVLPRACPERHINGDGSFCLCHPTPTIRSVDEANVWWQLLHRYLCLQRIAGRTGQWPAQQWLSHGEAGYHHERALNAAKRLGFEDLYYRNLYDEPAWFTGKHIVTDKSGSRLINGRSPCPVGCRGKRGRPILRTDCCRKGDVVTLVREERLRRAAEKAFWDCQRAAGTKCCGTMRNCPLNDAAEVGLG